MIFIDATQSCKLITDESVLFKFDRTNSPTKHTTCGRFAIDTRSQAGSIEQERIGDKPIVWQSGDQYWLL